MESNAPPTPRGGLPQCGRAQHSGTALPLQPAGWLHLPAEKEEAERCGAANKLGVPHAALASLMLPAHSCPIDPILCSPRPISVLKPSRWQISGRLHMPGTPIFEMAHMPELFVSGAGLDSHAHGRQPVGWRARLLNAGVPLPRQHGKRCGRNGHGAAIERCGGRLRQSADCASNLLWGVSLDNAQNPSTENCKYQRQTSRPVDYFRQS